MIADLFVSQPFVSKLANSLVEFLKTWVALPFPNSIGARPGMLLCVRGILDQLT